MIPFSTDEKIYTSNPRKLGIFANHDARDADIMGIVNILCPDFLYFMGFRGISLPR